VELSLVVRNPLPGTSPSKLPAIWTAPLKLQDNGRLAVSGPSKLGATCEEAVLQTASKKQMSLSSLVDACSVASAEGINIPAEQPAADDCVNALISYRDALKMQAAKTVNGKASRAAVQLPRALQWPPVIDARSSQDASSNLCPTGEIRSLRNSQECISCLWGTIVPTAAGMHALIVLALLKATSY
jgi:hypothetical protein